MFERRLESGQTSVLMIAATDGPPPIEVLGVPDMVRGASLMANCCPTSGSSRWAVAYPIGEH